MTRAYREEDPGYYTHGPGARSGYTEAKPRPAPKPLPSCQHCRAWGSIHAEFCPERKRPGQSQEMRAFAVAIVRALAAGEMGSLPDPVATALLRWLHTEDAHADQELQRIAQSMVGRESHAA